jgi:hypothetical protein
VDDKGRRWVWRVSLWVIKGLDLIERSQVPAPCLTCALDGTISLYRTLRSADYNEEMERAAGLEERDVLC